MPKQPQTEYTLRVPQVRILIALQSAVTPTYVGNMSRIQIAESASVSQSMTGNLGPISTADTQATKERYGKTSLIELGYVKQDWVDIDGMIEYRYSITTTGIAALKRFLAENKGVVPKVRKKESCINSRYSLNSANKQL